MAAIPMNARPKRHADVRYSIVPEGALVVHHSRGELKTLNPVGGFILDLLDGTRTVEQVVKRVVEEYQVERPQAMKDTEAFLEQLALNEVITLG
jgi:methyltransferase-like protein